MDDEVHSQVAGGTGIVTLNRPKALNSLNTNMVTKLQRIYTEWGRQGSNVHCVVLKGAGDRAFCAGGDVKSVVQGAMAGNIAAAMAFFKQEYICDYLIAQLKRPHVSLIDGIVMGGGAGLSMHGHFRVATERTLFAMPECGIGLFPDVAASHFLHKLPGRLGLYLGLTGTRLKGIAVKEAGLATHYLPSSLLPQVEQRLQQLGPRAADLGSVNQLLTEMEGEGSAAAASGAAGAAQASSSTGSGLLDKLPLIDACFGQDSVEKIVQALESSQHAAAFCKETLEALRRGSPLSAKVTFELLRRSRHMTLADCFQQDYVLCQHMSRGHGDFYEGVRATLIDKSRPAQWKYQSIADVPDSLVSSFFVPEDPDDRLPIAAATHSPRGRL